MDSSDEDVCLGPISLKEIEKALRIMDPFRNNKTDENDVILIDGSDSEPEDRLEKQDSNVILIDETCDSSFHSETKEPLETHGSGVILIDESSDSFMYSAPKKTNEHDLYNTRNWNNLVNNLSMKPNILDQTEPAEFHETLLENTIVPKSNNRNKGIFDLTGFQEFVADEDSLINFEEIEQLTDASTENTETNSVVPNNEDNLNSSMSSNVTSVYQTAEQSSVSDFNDCQSLKDVYVTAQNSSESTSETNSNKDQSYAFDSSIKVLLNDHTFTDPKDQINVSLEFDNTFEEMQYYMNMNAKTQEPSTPQHSKSLHKTKTSNPATPLQNKSINSTLTPENDTQSHPYPKFSPITPTTDVSTSIITPKSLLPEKRGKKTYYPMPKNLGSDFRVPTVPCTSAKKILSPRNNFSHIVSPIGMYIKNTPKTPLVENKTPKRNLMLTKSPLIKASNKNEGIKENIATNSPILSMKAYKASSYTAMNVLKSPAPISGMKKLIPNNGQYLIEHKNRIKHSSKLPKLITFKKEDSFANLSVSSAEISVCIQKTPTRVETLLKKK